MKAILRIVFFLLLLFADMTIAISQITILDSTKVFIKESQQVDIKGSLQNQSPEFKNQGDIRIKGDIWNEAAVSNPGKGIIRLAGDEEQTLFLFDTLEVFDIEIDNKEGVTLHGSEDLNVNSHVSFERGMINTNAFCKMSFRPNATYSGASDSSHIEGPAVKAGAEDFEFPIGKNGKMKKASVSDLTESTTFQAEYFDDPFETLETDSTLTQVNDQEYWQVAQVEGNAKAKLILPYDTGNGTLNPEELKIAHFQDSLWTGKDAETDGGSPETSISSVDQLQNFGFFTVAEAPNYDADIAEFFAFQTSDCETELNWLMPAGTRVIRYEIERSVDGVNFETIGSVAGDSQPLTNLEFYEFTDTELFEESIIYYRLKLVAPNGSFNYSGVISLENDCIFEDFELLPNPVKSSDNIRIRVYSETGGEMPLKIIDVPGHILHEQTLTLEPGRHEYEIYTAALDLPAAPYFISITARNTLKFMVIR